MNIEKSPAVRLFGHSLLVLGVALSANLRADPGDPPRPLIVNNTVYSGLDGHKLRGDHVDVAWSRNALNPSTWSAKKDILFNFRRVDGNKPRTEGDSKLNTDPALWKAIDSCVNLAARAGQYMQLLYGGSPASNGGTHQLEFWRMAAPRYKNRTHVLYGLKNEPAWEWLASVDTIGPLYGCPCHAHMVRDSAPDSFIFPFSTKDGLDVNSMVSYRLFLATYKTLYGVDWDWSNSAVAFHGYGDMTAWDDLKASFPGVEDEVPSGSWGNIQKCEEKGLAWNYYDGKQPWDATAMKNAAVAGGYAWWTNPKMMLSEDTIKVLKYVGLSDPPASAVLTVNDGAGTLSDLTTSISYQQGSNWLSVQRTGTGNLQRLTNTVSSANLTSGVYRATVTVTCSNSSPATTTYPVIFDYRQQSNPDTILVTPPSAIVGPGATVQFKAKVVDQYGDSLQVQPSQLIWSVSGGGTISSTGLFTAGASVGGPHTVSARVTIGSAVVQGSAKVSVTNYVSGLNYSCYDGIFALIPNFPWLTPVKTGIVQNFDISVASNPNFFGMSFQGYIRIPADGSYTFYSMSDDGSKLYIDNSLLANADGLHPAGALDERSGTVTLTAGLHAIRVDYINNGGDKSLTVRWASTGAGITKQPIPNDVLFITGAATRVRGAIPTYKHVTISAKQNALVGSVILNVHGQGTYAVRMIGADGRMVTTLDVAGERDFRIDRPGCGVFIVEAVRDGVTMRQQVVVR